LLACGSHNSFCLQFALGDDDDVVRLSIVMFSFDRQDRATEYVSIVFAVLGLLEARLSRARSLANRLAEP
jgi:hypothetical protein